MAVQAVVVLRRLLKNGKYPVNICVEFRSRASDNRSKLLFSPNENYLKSRTKIIAVLVL